MKKLNLEDREKKSAALSSVIASIFLTGGKLTVGLMTGSLGIMSEAAHSALDLGAALITYFAVKISGRPADNDHNYGHYKVENLSALAETFLLLITCIWIIKEAVSRLLNNTTPEVNIWSYAVIICSIIIDFSRARVLSKTAKKYKSQALEADAMHFSSDILSSAVVLLGLALTQLNIKAADAAAALMVAILVIVASIRLSKRAIDSLMDKAPNDLSQKILQEISSIEGVSECHKLRLRNSGSRIYGDLHVVIKKDVSFQDGHQISNMIESKMDAYSIDMVVHFEPETENE